MTPQFVKDNYDLIKGAFADWLHDIKNNAQYGNGIFGGGDVRELEKKCCQLFHSKYALAVSSGTAALHTSLISLDVKKNTNVIILGSTWAGLASLVLACGANPIYVERDNYALFLKINCQQFKNNTILIYVRSKNDESFFKKVYFKCLKKKIPIIEDWSAQREIDFEKVTAPLYGVFAVFSFGYNKWIQTGEGGVVLLNREDYYKKIICFTQHPISIKAHGILNTNDVIPGLNYRIHPFSARLALVQLNMLLQNDGL